MKFKTISAVVMGTLINMAGLVYADANAGYLIVASGTGGDDGASAGSANVSGTSTPSGNVGNGNIGNSGMPGTGPTGSGASNIPGEGAFLEQE